jgi:uncharacterized protein (DUF427 family)
MSENATEIRIEPCAKRVRAYLGGHLVFDTTDARLVWEVPYYPQYYIPRGDVHAEMAATGRSRTSRSRGRGMLHTVRVDGNEATEAATIYPSTSNAELDGLVRFTWDALDAWFEEDEEVFFHPRSPYVRVDILPTSRRVTVEAAGIVVAESEQAYVLYETGLPPRYYLPKVDVHMDRLVPSEHVTGCPYKGQTEYWSIDLGGSVLEDAAWSYPHPLPESARIAGLVSFEPARVDVIVDGVVMPSR